MLWQKMLVPCWPYRYRHLTGRAGVGLIQMVHWTWVEVIDNRSHLVRAKVISYQVTQQCEVTQHARFSKTTIWICWSTGMVSYSRIWPDISLPGRFFRCMNHRQSPLHSAFDKPVEHDVDCRHQYQPLSNESWTTAFIVLHRRWRHETRIWYTEYSLIILSHIVRIDCGPKKLAPCYFSEGHKYILVSDIGRKAGPIGSFRLIHQRNPKKFHMEPFPKVLSKNPL
jgi:hypothetical protein